jgi:hypothetical protein
MMNREYLEQQLASFERQRMVAMAQVNQAVGAIAAVNAILEQMDKTKAEQRPGLVEAA